MSKKRPHDLSSLSGRIRTWLHFYLKDHHLLRMAWWNLAEISPGVWRSNQPSPWRLRRMRARGVTTVVSLRGGVPQSYNVLEEKACADLGLGFERLTGVMARELVPAANMLAIVDGLAAIEGAKLFHCKSGADRTGLIATLYLILVDGVDVAEAACTQLRPGWVHLPRTRAGVLDHIFRVYLRDAAPAGQGFRDWLETVYDPAEVQADFDDWRAGAGRWAV
ncbi:tyrosine-protein phosphatase [Pseudooctadecabacter sp.]|uniref:tyrosine-protein phosphatase n=1 Tax=Pseudooctadecabacter sp. TaxID=1966338 RepID=UPI0035C8410B